MTNDRDEARCNHGLDVIVSNQPGGFDPKRPLRSVWVCFRPECVLDAMAWVQRGTGEKPWVRVGVTGEWNLHYSTVDHDEGF